ncbi:hypothetical protein HFN89_02130 [Rhizobium laguerreae]|nr:hypothetical protein [Rhizobium laguerreae]
MPETNGEPRYDVKWQDDLQGKKNCDISLVTISCRYYPESYSQNGKPSCSVSLCLGDEETIASADLYGDTEAEVKAAAEEWAATTANAIRAAMLACYKLTA